MDEEGRQVTTIVYANGVLAGDSCSWSAGVRRKVKKVFHVKNAERGELLVGFAGNPGFALKTLDWMSGKGDRPNPRDFFALDDLPSQFALAVDRDVKVWTMSQDLIWHPSEESMYALGAGHEFAWGALEAGATAVQAVEIAIKRSDFAGLGVDWVSFDGMNGGRP